MRDGDKVREKDKQPEGEGKKRKENLNDKGCKNNWLEFVFGEHR